MIRRAVPALLLVWAVTAEANRPVPPTPPEPPPVEDDAAVPAEDFTTDDEVDPDDPAADDVPPPRTRKKPALPSKNELTDEQAGALGIGSLCCCSLFLAALLGLIVWLVKRGSRTPRPISSASFQSPASIQLSIFALALEPRARELIELGVSRLDDPLQVKNALEDRLQVLDAELLGAELLWAPTQLSAQITEAEIALRFPEMMPLGPR